MDTAIFDRDFLPPGRYEINGSCGLRVTKRYISHVIGSSLSSCCRCLSNNAIMPTTSRGLDRTDGPNQRKNSRADLAAMEAAGVKPDIPADWTEMPD